MKNSAGRGGCNYAPRPKAEVDNILQDLQNSSYPTKAEFNNCFIFIQNIFKLLKEKMSFTVNNLEPVYPFFLPRRKTFVKLLLTPLQLQDF